MKVCAKSSFVMLTYPFVFDRDRLDARRDQLESLGWDKETGAARPLPAAATDTNVSMWRSTSLRHGELLPQVREYLRGDCARGSEGCVALEMNANLMQSRALALSDGGTTWTFDVPGRTAGTVRTVGFSVQGIRLILFRIGVGFLTMQTRAESEEPDDWFDLIHYLRFMRVRGRPVRATRRTGRDRTEPFRPPLGSPPAQPVEPMHGLGEITEWLMDTGALPDDAPAERWWTDAFLPEQMLPFPALLIDDVPPGEADPILYRTANFFHSTQQLHPSPADLPPANGAFMPYADRCWFICSADGAAFVAINPPRASDGSDGFFRGPLFDHVRDQYATLHLMVLHQRLAFVDILRRVAELYTHPHGRRARRDERCRSCAGGDLLAEDFPDADAPGVCADCGASAFRVPMTRRERVLGDTFDRVMELNARGYFALVAQRDHHQRFYELCQRRMRIADLVEEVNDEVGRMHDFVMMLQQRRIEADLRRRGEVESERERLHAANAARVERRINLIVGIVAVPALVCSFMGVNLGGWTAATNDISLLAALGVVVASGVVGWRLFSRIALGGQRPPHD